MQTWQKVGAKISRKNSCSSGMKFGCSKQDCHSLQEYCISSRVAITDQGPHNAYDQALNPTGMPNHLCQILHSVHDDRINDICSLFIEDDFASILA